MTPPRESDQTKVAVLNQKVDDLREDVREVKNLVSEKIATKEYVDDRFNPLKRLIYFLLSLFTALLIAMIGWMVAGGIK